MTCRKPRFPCNSIRFVFVPGENLEESLLQFALQWASLEPSPYTHHRPISSFMRVDYLMSDADLPSIEDLLSEYMERRRQGELIGIDQYAREHPEFSEEIRELFPTLSLLEYAKDRMDIEKHEEFSGQWEEPVPEMLGDYRLLREIGAGGMGVVYEATQESMQRRVAVKVLPSLLMRNATRRQRFLQEARTAAKLTHRNIVPVIDYGQANGRCYFVMRLIEGVGLDWIILRLSHQNSPLTSTEVRHQYSEQGVSVDYEEEEVQEDSLASEFEIPEPNQAAHQNYKWILKPDSWRQIARIGVQACRALDHAHKAGVLHRDIKPANLLLDEDGIIWITDFGLAKVESDPTLTAPSDIVGTLRYLPPERFEGQADARSDLYSLGLTLYELCTGRPAFLTHGKTEMIRNILEGEIVPAKQLNPLIPVELERILMHSLARDPDYRYQNATEMLTDLRKFIKGETPTPQNLKSKKTTWEFIQENVVAFTLLFICIILMIMITTFWFQDRQATRNSTLTSIPEEVETNSFTQRLFVVDDLLALHLGIDDLQPLLKNNDEEIAIDLSQNHNKQKLSRISHLYHQLKLDANIAGDVEIKQKSSSRMQLIESLLQRNSGSQ